MTMIITFLSLSFTAYEICYSGQIRLGNSVNHTYDNDSEYISGYPVICVDNEFVPFCNNTRFSPRDISYICASSSSITCELVFVYHSCSMYVLHVYIYVYVHMYECTHIVHMYTLMYIYMHIHV